MQRPPIVVPPLSLKLVSASPNSVGFPSRHLEGRDGILPKEEKEVLEQVLESVDKERKYYIDVPEGFGPLGFMLLGYMVVGQIQKNYPAFQNNISVYKQRVKTWTWLSPLQGRN